MVRKARINAMDEKLKTGDLASDPEVSFFGVKLRSFRILVVEYYVYVCTHVYTFIQVYAYMTHTYVYDNSPPPATPREPFGDEKGI